MTIDESKRLSSDEVSRLLKQISKQADSPASFQIGISKAFNSELVNSKKLKEIKDALYKEVGEEGWNNEWDF